MPPSRFFVLRPSSFVLRPSSFVLRTSYFDITRDCPYRKRTHACSLSSYLAIAFFVVGIRLAAATAVYVDPFVWGKSTLSWAITVTMFAIGWMLPKEEVNLVAKRWPTVLGGTAHAVHGDAATGVCLRPTFSIGYRGNARSTDGWLRAGCHGVECIDAQRTGQYQLLGRVDHIGHVALAADGSR